MAARSGDDRQVCHRLLQRLALARRAIIGMSFPMIPWPMTPPCSCCSMLIWVCSQRSNSIEISSRLSRAVAQRHGGSAAAAAERRQRRQRWGSGGAHQPSAHRGYHRHCAAAVNAAAATLPPLCAAAVNAAAATLTPLRCRHCAALPPLRIASCRGAGCGRIASCRGVHRGGGGRERASANLRR